jgi:transposase-like protein
MGNYNTETKDWFSSLEKTLREGARRLLQSILEVEVDEYLRQCSEIVDKNNRRLVKRNGYCPERSILTGIGPISFKRPRVRDNRSEHKFTSKVLPPYMRKVASLDNLIPALYLKGISTRDFGTALESILGPDYKGFSPKSVERLKEGWIFHPITQPNPNLRPQNRPGALKKHFMHPRAVLAFQ